MTFTDGQTGERRQLGDQTERRGGGQVIRRTEKRGKTGDQTVRHAREDR